MTFLYDCEDGIVLQIRDYKTCQPSICLESFLKSLSTCHSFSVFKKKTSDYFAKEFFRILFFLK